MKSILFILFITLLFNFSFAQGNLQFNKVVFYEADTTLICTIGGACVDSFLIRDIIVPAGKVLKIESINVAQGSTFGYYFYLSSFRYRFDLGQYNPYVFPIWLPAGIYRVKYATGNPNNPSQIDVNGKFSYQFSAIEFNITQ